MDNIFRTRALTMAINIMKPVPMRILEAVFRMVGIPRGQTSDRLAWEIKVSSEKIMKNISVAAPATVTKENDRKVITCNAPRFAEKRFISAADLNAIRAFGSEMGPELLTTRVNENLADMRGIVDRSREFMAAKALGGQIVDKDGAVLVDFNFSGDQKPVLAGATKWTDASSDPLKNIRAWKKLIEQKCGVVSGFMAYAGSDVMDALLSHPKILELMKYQVGNQLANTGRIANLAEVAIEEYNGSYVNDAGPRFDMIPADKFILIGKTNDGAGELFAPVVDLKAPDGVGTGRPGSVFFSKSWEDEDPSGRWIKVEARPLPVLFRPEIIVYADPV